MFIVVYTVYYLLKINKHDEGEHDSRHDSVGQHFVLTVANPILVGTLPAILIERWEISDITNNT